MTLIEICEPLLLYVCRLNRSARKGGHYELGQVQGEIRGLLAETKSKAMGAQLSEQYDKVELVLLFFVDFMVKESALPFARDWKELAFERNELAGDEKFFDLLEETLKDQSAAAKERLAVFYHCLGLGFTGWYTGQPEYLRRKMKELAGRISAGTDSGGDVARICPDAYENVDTRDLVEPPGAKLLGISIALVGLIIVLFVAMIFLYKDNTKQLIDATQDISKRDYTPQVITLPPAKESK